MYTDTQTYTIICTHTHKLTYLADKCNYSCELEHCICVDMHTHTHEYVMICTRTHTVCTLLTNATIPTNSNMEKAFLSASFDAASLLCT